MANGHFPPLKPSSVRTYSRADPGRQTAKQKLIRSAHDSHTRSKRREFDLTSTVKHRLLFLVLLAPLPLPAQRQIVSVPFRSVNSYMLVEACIDGTPVTLMVDTGANKTILNARSIGRVQLPVSQPVNQGAGIIGNALRLCVHVEIAHQCMFSQSVSVMNLEDLSKRFQIHFDGLLGQDILNQFRAVRIDYKAHVIELER